MQHRKFKKMTVYSKFCLPCIYKDFWSDFQKRAFEKGYKLKVVRTTYRPLAHKKATEIWGDEYYTSFVVYPNGCTRGLKEIINMWNGVKDKRVKSGKKKPVMKGKNGNVQGLRKTEGAIRANRVGNSTMATTTKTKAKVEES